VALALYRKYRPARFADVVGQEHVTGPLRIALEAGRINHAYLFSGPRGCGKTSSARILARSLNCVDGPTPDPCGVCSSCVALAPEGPGNIDVVELDAASHGGVDDARELRDRAFYAPAESRYRVFIVDEAHMVTTQGFNALLKIVEEPPDHLVFVFATTEPEKVLPTIRSRTHHYPFRLIPPSTLRALLERICAEEGAVVAPAVFPLVLRAGGGSARDTLSLLDQLLAGAGPEGVTYERAVALLGVTDVSLIDDVVDALAAGDRAAVFEGVDRLVEAGLDPRRFAADLLQRLRDLTLVQAIPDAAQRGLVDVAADEVERMVEQSERLGPATLVRYGEILHAGLIEMRGATAPRLLLELLCARMLLPAATASEPSLLERLERIELRASIAAVPVPHGETAAAPPPEPGDTQSAAARRTFTRRRAVAGSPEEGDRPEVAAGPTAREPAVPVPTAAPEAPATPAPERPGADEVERTEPEREREPAPVAAEPVDGAAPRPQAIPEKPAPEQAAEPPAPVPSDRPAARVVEAPGPATDTAPARDDRRAPQEPVDVPPAAPASIDAAAVRRVWSEILAAAKQRSRSTGALLVNATVRAIEGDVIVLAIGSEPLARRLSEQRNTDVIADALHAVLGVRWRVRCDHGDAPPSASARPAASRAPAPPQRPSRPAPTRPAPTRRSAPEEAEPLPPEPPDEDAPPDDEEAMMAEAAADSASPAVRRDPEEVAIELLSAQLGATAMDRR
jgi:DNA polymerase III subunit gamma/tau